MPRRLWRLALLEADHPAVLAHRCEWGGGVVVAVHNLSSEKVSTRLDLSDYSDDALARPVQRSRLR